MTITGTGSLTWDEFFAIPDGTRVFNHGYDQCVAVANLFHEGVRGLPFVAVPNARAWWERRANLAAIRDNYHFLDPNAATEPGDIFVSLGGIYDGVDGHIGVIGTASNAGGAVVTLEQNTSAYAPQRWLYRHNRSRAFWLGILRPTSGSGGGSAKPTPPPKKKDSDMYGMKWAGVPNSGIIVGQEGPPQSLHDSVYAAYTQGLKLDTFELPDWQYKTIVRELWAATNRSSEAIAKATAGKVLTISDSPLKADDVAGAVADELAERLRAQ